MPRPQCVRDEASEFGSIGQIAIFDGVNGSGFRSMREANPAGFLRAGHARPLRNTPLHSRSGHQFGIESVHNYVMSLITRHNWVLRLGLVLLLAGQVFSVAHASEFGRAPHEHDGVLCVAILTDEQEGLVPTANLKASAFIALVAAVPQSARDAPLKCCARFDLRLPALLQSKTL